MVDIRSWGVARANSFQSAKPLQVSSIRAEGGGVAFVIEPQYAAYRVGEGKASTGVVGVPMDTLTRAECSADGGKQSHRF